MPGPFLVPVLVVSAGGRSYVLAMEPLSSDIRHWVERAIGSGTTVTATEILKAKPTQPTWLLHLNEPLTPTWSKVSARPIEVPIQNLPRFLLAVERPWAHPEVFK